MTRSLAENTPRGSERDDPCGFSPLCRLIWRRCWFIVQFFIDNYGFIPDCGEEFRGGLTLTGGDSLDVFAAVAHLPRQPGNAIGFDFASQFVNQDNSALHMPGRIAEAQKLCRHIRPQG